VAAASCLYGDTDSVFLLLPASTATVAEAFALAECANEQVSSSFGECVTLELEKLYFDVLQSAKKRYCTLRKYESPDDSPKMDFKGIDVKLESRKGCLAMRRGVRACVEAILEPDGLSGAAARVAAVKRGLLALRDSAQDHADCPTADLVLNTLYGKELEQYSAATVVKTLVTERAARGIKDQVGDRLEFILARDHAVPAAHKRKAASLGLDAAKRRRNTATDSAVCAERLGEPDVHPDRAVVFQKKTASKVVPLLSVVLPAIADAAPRRKSLVDAEIERLTQAVERRGAPMTALERLCGTATRPAPALPGDLDARLAACASAAKSAATIASFFK